MTESANDKQCPPPLLPLSPRVLLPHTRLVGIAPRGVSNIILTPRPLDLGQSTMVFFLQNSSKKTRNPQAGIQKKYGVQNLKRIPFSSIIPPSLCTLARTALRWETYNTTRSNSPPPMLDYRPEGQELRATLLRFKKLSRALALQ